MHATCSTCETRPKGSHTNTQLTDCGLTLTNPTVAHKPGQAGANERRAARVAAERSLGNVAVVTSCLAVVDRAPLLCGTRHKTSQSSVTEANGWKGNRLKRGGRVEGQFETGGQMDPGTGTHRCFGAFSWWPGEF